MPFTFHSHSGQFCRHAKGTLEAVVQGAIARNMLVLGLSEHVPRSRAQDMYPEEADMGPDDLHAAFDGYVAEARRLREKYAGQIEILIGAETEYITEASLAEARRLRERHGLDYLVGSLHHVDETPVDFGPDEYAQIVRRCGGDRAEVFRRYFDQQLAMLQALQPEVVGHFDLVRIFHPYDDDGVADPLQTVPEIRALALRNIDYAISYGAVFEINSRAWKKGLRDAYPQRDVLAEILRRGGRVTISDDSHGAQDLCMHYDRLHAYLCEMGVRDLCYLRRTPGGRAQALVLEDAMEEAAAPERAPQRRMRSGSYTAQRVPAHPDISSEARRRLSNPNPTYGAHVQVPARKSLTVAEAGQRGRRRSLAYADLMAVFYPPNVMSQPTVSDMPFECAEQECPQASEHDDDMAAAAAAAHWEPTLKRAINSIVSIKAQCVRSFDTETSGTYTATGFVVDVDAGLILSNRHVVNPAPIVAQAVFANYEEVELQPVYRDPVHDFGFFRFDPARLRFMRPESIRLAPHKAKVGMEIRVVGNDAGEKLSILAGTLARLDRAAPEYGVGEYNDFNTFYLQAASGTSGGSSGSPVLDIYGDAVALNAGGSKKAASSFYLPLWRIVRALDLVRRGQPVPRGTVQAEFEHLPYDELRRLGLDISIETKMRETFPDSQGMLAVHGVLPGGPADGILRAGDIVVALNGQPVVDFVAVEAAADGSVGRDIKVSVWRGSKAYDTAVRVQDMDAVTPHRYIEVGGGIVNELSYQVARSYGIAAGGVYVASSGHVLGSASIWRGSVIQSVGGTATPTLDSFAQALGALHDGERVPVRYYALDQPYKQKVAVMSAAMHWHATRMATRSMATGEWAYQDLAAPARLPPGSAPAEPQTATPTRLPASLAPGDKVWPGVVLLDFHCPYLVDGMKNTHFLGPGFVIDKERGYIVCDRDTVPISIGDVHITIAGSVVLVGRVDFLHPVYNFAVVKYDPRLVDGAAVDNIQFHPEYLSGQRRLEQGDPVWIVAVSSDQGPVVRHTRVASRSMVSTRECQPPRFRCINAEGIRLNDQPACQGGVLCDEDGLVKGLWTSVSSQDSGHKDTTTMTGFDASILRQTIESLAATGEYPDVRSLDVELWTVRLAAARALGLDPQRIRQVEAAGGAGSSSSSPRLLYVTGVLTSGSAASRLLRTGDVILEKNGRPAHAIADLGVIHGEEHVDLVVLRDGREVRLRVPTTRLDGMGTRRVVHWSGALVQAPYCAVLEQVRRVPSAVYVSCTLYGSPANCYGLRPGMWITEVEGRPVRTVSDFVSTIEGLRLDREGQRDKEAQGTRAPPKDMQSARYVRLTVVNKNEVTRVLSLRVDNHYWPPWELVRDLDAPSGWRYKQSI
ncbi:hypothetical protein H4R18_005714 [Coemansia javaensis]|uniref:histidinol-phosphatase n=1 Tax=Coemansia javaensis TaxID=2761396 RepID=A0A9W8LDU8_9FUNG|nr:hypothetical protein H4R18_005714 [Coemansia javaensis]